VNSTRTAENLTRLQRVPSQYLGGSVQLTAVLGQHTLVGGAEARNVRGVSNEIAVMNDVRTALVDSGGREIFAGVFVQDFVKAGERLVIAGGLRYDRWRNYDASSITQSVATNITTVNAFPDRVESAISPQLSALFHVSDTVSLYANASRSFRAPTLNELYRGFRVGNVLTLANEDLRSERADNIEGGFRVGYKAATLKTSIFWTRINRAVANVTLMSTPTLITRQRQNAGKTRSRGVEIEVETRWRELSVSAGYLLADSRVFEFPANMQLVGLQVPQVPRHQFTAQLNYSLGLWTIAVQGRASSKQFDDDLNVFALEPYAQLDFFAARRVKEALKVYVGIENVLNSRYSVGKTPVRTLNSPVSLRLGVRWN
jgi:outer membrane receptor protein involved in Fe transport